MNPGNCDGAVADLKAQMPGAIGPFLAWFSIRNDVVAFACNRGGDSAFAYVPSYTTALERITAACGRYIAGSYHWGDNGYPYIVGYMRYHNGLDFCAASTTSPADRC